MISIIKVVEVVEGSTAVVMATISTATTSKIVGDMVIASTVVANKVIMMEEK